MSCRFAVSYRDVEELLAERGVIATDEMVRRSCRKFGQAYANELRRRRPRPGDTWHLDGVFIAIDGSQRSLWRAVDQDGNVPAIPVQARRDKRAATTSLRELLKGRTYVPPVVITDKRASDGAAARTVLPRVAHRRHTGRNHRAENAHHPPASANAGCGAARARAATAYRQASAERFATRRAVTGTSALA